MRLFDFASSRKRSFRAPKIEDSQKRAMCCLAPRETAHAVMEQLETRTMFPVSLQSGVLTVNNALGATALPTPLFTGDSYTLNLAFGGQHPATSWAINWGDGTAPQTVAANPSFVLHTFSVASGAAPYSISASANTTDGAVSATPLNIMVYNAPVLSGGRLSLAGTGGNDIANFSVNAGVFAVNFNGASRMYNSSLVTKASYVQNGGNDIITNNTTSNLNITAASTGKSTINATSGTTIIPANSGTGIRQLDFAAINISAGAKVIFANSSATLGDYSKHANRNVAVVDAGGLNISSGGTLDMGDNDMILKYAPANESATNTQVFNLLKTGITTNIDWSGTGITSSEANYDANFSIGARAVGFMDNNNWGDSSFDGVALADFNQVLVKFTYYGDVNCDGIFDSQDVNQLISGRSHIAGATGWENCDLDYDDVTSTSTDQNLFFTGRSAYQTFGAL